MEKTQAKAKVETREMTMAHAHTHTYTERDTHRMYTAKEEKGRRARPSSKKGTTTRGRREDGDESDEATTDTGTSHNTMGRERKEKQHRTTNKKARRDGVRPSTPLPRVSAQRAPPHLLQENATSLEFAADAPYRKASIMPVKARSSTWTKNTVRVTQAHSGQAGRCSPNTLAQHLYAKTEREWEAGTCSAREEEKPAPHQSLDMMLL